MGKSRMANFRRENVSPRTASWPFCLFPCFLGIEDGLPNGSNAVPRSIRPCLRANCSHTRIPTLARGRSSSTAGHWSCGGSTGARPPELPRWSSPLALEVLCRPLGRWNLPAASFHPSRPSPVPLRARGAACSGAPPPAWCELQPPTRPFVGSGQPDAGAGTPRLSTAAPVRRVVHQAGRCSCGPVTSRQRVGTDVGAASRCRDSPRCTVSSMEPSQPGSQPSVAETLHPSKTSGALLCSSAAVAGRPSLARADKAPRGPIRRAPIQPTAAGTAWSSCQRSAVRASGRAAQWTPHPQKPQQGT